MFLNWLGFGNETERPPRKRPIKFIDETVYMSEFPLMKTHGFYEHGFPQGAVIHLTAGNETIGHQSVQYALSQDHCYFVIDMMGIVHQQFEIQKWGSHAGRSEYPGLGTSLSKKLVGIEIQNPGKLVKKDIFDPISWFGKRYEKAEYFDYDHNIEKGWYLPINGMQMRSLQKLIVDLKSIRPDVFDLDFVLGHDEIAKGRKTDPGGALGMNMDQFRSSLKSLYLEYSEVYDDLSNTII